MPPAFQDDKSPICVPFILDHLSRHQQCHPDLPRPPLIIGLNGIQGVGKTTLVAALTLALEKHGAHAVVSSIDDFYLKHDDQVALAQKYPDNALVQHRGEPGTHDVGLAIQVFTALSQGKPTYIPQYDKSAFSGQGDRLPESQWLPANQPGQPTVDVVILEGWSVGFRALSPAQVEAKWKSPSRTLQKHKLEHLNLVNERLAAYDAFTNLFDAFIHIDSEDTEYVYIWRQQQEDHLREIKGDANAGMTKEQVIKFVDGYYPAYELYTDNLRNGVIANRPGSQLRLIVGHDRKVRQTLVI